MITTGIIKNINVSKTNSTLKNNLYEVEVPILKNPIELDKNVYTLTCTACLPGGLYNPYEIGDMVYVSFVDNEISNGVILGKIYKGNLDEARGYEYLKNMKISESAELPENTKIGSYDIKNLFDSVNNISNLNSKVDNLDPGFFPKEVMSILHETSSGIFEEKTNLVCVVGQRQLNYHDYTIIDLSSVLSKIINVSLSVYCEQPVSLVYENIENDSSERYQLYSPYWSYTDENRNKIVLYNETGINGPIYYNIIGEKLE